MRWLDVFRRNRSSDLTDESLNLDGLLAKGLKDKASAKSSVARLNREREAIIRVQRVLIGDSKTLSPGNVKMIARGAANPSMTELGTLELSRAMRDSSSTSSAGIDVSSQLAMLDERLAAIDRTRSQLYAAIDRFP